MARFRIGAKVAGALVPAALALVGCWWDDSHKVSENATPVQADFHKEALELVTKSLADPTNIRDAGISDPELRPVEGLQRYVACVRFNPRTPNHDYMGITERIAYFYGGHVNQFLKAAPGECSFAVYRPFPELEKYCQGARCD